MEDISGATLMLIVAVIFLVIVVGCIGVAIYQIFRGRFKIDYDELAFLAREEESQNKSKMKN